MPSNDAPLFEALEKRDFTEMKKALKGSLFRKGVDVNAPDEKGRPALCIAADRGDLEMIQFLLDEGADIEAKYDGFTALMLATRKGSADIVKLLLERGADPNEPGLASSRALHFALGTGTGTEEIVELLLSHGAEVDCRDSMDVTPLLDAASRGYDGIIPLLLARGADMNARTQGGRTPLMLAASNGHEETCALLVSKGGDVNAKDDQGMTALSLAYKYGHNKAAKTLRDGKAAGGPAVNDELYAACGPSGDPEIVGKLLNEGASPDSVNGEKSSCLYHAARRGNIAAARLLLEKGADVDFCEDGLTPLVAAIERGSLELAVLLLERGACAYKGDFDSRTFKTVRTPLGAALGRLDLEIAELLVSKGAELDFDATIEALAPVPFLAGTMDPPDGRLSSFFGRYNSRVGSLSPSLYAEAVKFLVRNKADFGMLGYSTKIPNAMRDRIASSRNIIDAERTGTALLDMLKKALERKA